MLILLRHGTTELNIKGVVQGNTDAKLTIEGCHQIELAAAKMIDWGTLLKMICCSPAKRAIESAQIIQKQYPETVLRIESCLRERDIGKFEGLSRGELIAERDRCNIKGVNIWQDWDECKEVESDALVFKRASRMLDSLTRTIDIANTDVLWVTHSGVIKSFIRYACSDDGGYSRLYVGCGGIVRIWQDPKTRHMTIDQAYNIIEDDFHS